VLCLFFNLDYKGKLIMKLQVKIKNIYGVKRIYPVNDTAGLLTGLTGHKTLDDRAINIIKALGYEIEVMPEKI